MASHTISVALHIGAHKTATTHLQKTLQENRALLADAGLFALTPGELRDEGQTINDQFGINGAPPLDVDGAQRVRSMLPDGTRRLVLSEENFIGSMRGDDNRVVVPLYPNAEKRIAAFVDKLAPVPVDVFLAVREPCAFLASCYGQFLLGGHFVSPGAFFMDRGPEVLDWVDLVRRVRSVPGLRILGVWPYEAYPRNAIHIFRHMLRWRMGRLMEPRDKRSHPGLSDAAVRATLEWHAKGQEGDLAQMARELFPLGPEFPKFNPFPDELRTLSGRLYHDQLRDIRDMEGVTYLSYLHD